MSWFLKVNLLICMCVYTHTHTRILLVLFLWRTQIATVLNRYCHYPCRKSRNKCGKQGAKCDFSHVEFEGPMESIERCACMRAQSCPTLQPCGLCPASLLSPWNSTGKNTGVGCHFLLQGIFPIQGLKLRWQADSLPLCHMGSPDGRWGISNSILLGWRIPTNW